MTDNEHEIPVKVVDRRWWARGEDGEGAAAERSSSKPSYVEDLERQLAEKDRQLQDAIGKYRQAAAEFDDSRLRLRREISKDIERGRREILADLLDVVDNLDRAVESASHGASAEAVLQGVEMVRRQFLTKLEGLGVTRIESAGEAFDPAVHEAITTVPAQSDEQDGRVVGVVRHGYRIGEEVLRPASVAVAKS
ncbi:MAG: nucleotide exchange factor GrpE [Acidobacteria bacterium RIFCSPLOWO2_02_FULL_67_36]|nr:MAG: nucleotide exchange factor GrpE [Acidobacteria bacterium RIFCSPLOWO2_02_FULL_67_36]OFW18558.1 MAG: nucleotide exchange factor GrpE [Acidobacteria bacterium RIFCSPLOWO2_12_FULL_66_21]